MALDGPCHTPRVSGPFLHLAPGFEPCLTVSRLGVRDGQDGGNQIRDPLGLPNDKRGQQQAMGAGLFYETRRVPAQELLPTGDQYPVGDIKVENEIEYWSREDSRRENKH